MLRSLAWRSLREGILGSTLEDSLQRLIEEFPAALAGAQMEPDSDDPPRFVLLCREAPVAGWALDHLLADQRGVPTLLEAKLMENPESRRAVIGQIMDYAANAYDAWGRGRIREIAAEYWGGRASTVDEALAKTFGREFDVETFWSEVERNLENGRVRLIVAADEVRPEARRVIEYLNERLSQVEVYGLELACFTTDGDSEIVVVPRLVGVTQAARDRKSVSSPSRAKTNWTPDLIRESIDPTTSAGRQFLDLMDWALQRDRCLGGRTADPSFAVCGRSQMRILFVYWHAGMYLSSKVDRYPSPQAREAVFATLAEAGLLVRDFDPDTSDGRYLRKGIETLSPTELAAVKEALTQAIA